MNGHGQGRNAAWNGPGRGVAFTSTPGHPPCSGESDRFPTTPLAMAQPPVSPTDPALREDSSGLGGGWKRERGRGGQQHKPCPFQVNIEQSRRGEEGAGVRRAGATYFLDKGGMN